MHFVSCLQVSLLYTAPTAIRSLMAKGNDIVRKASRKSLRILGTVGEPINVEAWKWYNEVLLHCLLAIIRSQPHSPAPSVNSIKTIRPCITHGSFWTIQAYLAFCTQVIKLSAYASLSRLRPANLLAHAAGFDGVARLLSGFGDVDGILHAGRDVNSRETPENNSGHNSSW